MRLGGRGGRRWALGEWGSPVGLGGHAPLVGRWLWLLVGPGGLVAPPCPVPLLGRPLQPDRASPWGRLGLALGRWLLVGPVGLGGLVLGGLVRPEFLAPPVCPVRPVRPVCFHLVGPVFPGGLVGRPAPPLLAPPVGRGGMLLRGCPPREGLRHL